MLNRNFFVVLNRNFSFPVEFSLGIAVFLWNFAEAAEKKVSIEKIEVLNRNFCVSSIEFLFRCSIETFWWCSIETFFELSVLLLPPYRSQVQLKVTTTLRSGL